MPLLGLYNSRQSSNPPFSGRARGRGRSCSLLQNSADGFAVDGQLLPFPDRNHFNDHFRFNDPIHNPDGLPGCAELVVPGQIKIAPLAEVFAEVWGRLKFFELASDLFFDRSVEGTKILGKDDNGTGSLFRGIGGSLGATRKRCRQGSSVKALVTGVTGIVGAAVARVWLRPRPLGTQRNLGYNGRRHDGGVRWRLESPLSTVILKS